MNSIEFRKEYLLLGLRMNKIIDGYVDAYFGPREFKEIVKLEGPHSPNSLLKSCNDLKSSLKGQNFGESREKFLKKTLDAIYSSLEIKMGKKLSYLEQVKDLFDIQPKLIEDSVFFLGVEELDSLYEGSGSLTERIVRSRKAKELSQITLKENFTIGFTLLRNKTRELFPELLAPQEEIKIKIVRDQPWSAYNWYLGEQKSRIDVNIDIPVIWTNILVTAAHEGYPGHHLHNSIKEKNWHEKNWFEQSILLISTPEAVISEGIANTGLDVLFTSKDMFQLAIDNLSPTPDEEDLELLVAQNIAWKKLSGFPGNLAILAYENGFSDKELIKYGLEFGFYNENRIKQQLKFIRDPLWATYIFTYFIGETMIKKKFGENPLPSDFKMLLTNPVLPSDLI
ncbi:MAG: hypothetical protein ACXACO_19195 [Promethearchaeota archaeon]|jgi:hypothetical protein